ncbi:MAG: hypothetical protein ABIC82_06825 [bacterium]
MKQTNNPAKSFFLLSMLLYKAVIVVIQIIYPKPNWGNAKTLDGTITAVSLEKITGNYYDYYFIIHMILLVVFIGSAVYFFKKQKEKGYYYIFIFLAFAALLGTDILGILLPTFEYGYAWGNNYLVVIVAIILLVSYSLFQKIEKDRGFKKTANREISIFNKLFGYMPFILFYFIISWYLVGSYGI